MRYLLVVQQASSCIRVDAVDTLCDSYSYLSTAVTGSIIRCVTRIAAVRPPLCDSSSYYSSITANPPPLRCYHGYRADTVDSCLCSAAAAPPLPVVLHHRVTAVRCATAPRSTPVLFPSPTLLWDSYSFYSRISFYIPTPPGVDITLLVLREYYRRCAIVFRIAVVLPSTHQL